VLTSEGLRRFASLIATAKREFPNVGNRRLMAIVLGATSEAARALRMEGQVGSLSAGAYGDLVAVKGDPLSDIRTLEHVDGVIKEGRLIN